MRGFKRPLPVKVLEKPWSKAQNSTFAIENPITSTEKAQVHGICCEFRPTTPMCRFAPRTVPGCLQSCACGPSEDR
jgi:hypothetical protein